MTGHAQLSSLHILLRGHLPAENTDFPLPCYPFYLNRLLAWASPSLEQPGTRWGKLHNSGILLASLTGMKLLALPNLLVINITLHLHWPLYSFGVLSLTFQMWKKDATCGGSFETPTNPFL